MADPLRRLSSDLRRMVTAALAAGDPIELILSRATQMLDDAGLDQALKNELLASAVAQYEWIGSRTLDPLLQQDLITILQTSGDAFATVGGNVNQEILEEVARGIRENIPSSELEDIIAHKVNKNKHHARTITTTALQALGRAERWMKGAEAGVTKWKYVGPSPVSDFCKQHYNKVYTRDEIDRMRNGTWEPVRLYGGHPRCTHQWIAVID